MPYITTAEGDAYALELLDDVWTAKTEEKKLRAVAQSTNAINRLAYRGTPVVGQVDAFPRQEQSVVPEVIKRATFYLALELLKGVDPDKEFNNLAIQSEELAIGKTTYLNARHEHILAGIPSHTAWLYLKPLLRDGFAVTIRRKS